MMISIIKNTLWSPLFIQKYFSFLRVNWVVYTQQMVNQCWMENDKIISETNTILETSSWEIHSLQMNER